MNVLYGGRPADWIVDHGRPARIVGSAGMPSYEDTSRKYVLLEFAIGMRDGKGMLKLYPRSYGKASAGSPDSSAVHLHLNERVERLAVVDLLAERGVDVIEFQTPPPRMWRPVLHYLRMDGWVAMGSQAELTHRHHLHALMWRIVQGYDSDDRAVELEVTGADDRAEALLRESLSPYQLLEYSCTGNFRVRGGCTANVYCVDVGDGFRLLHETTGETAASYCLHPESWVPDADVALAVKFALEDPELEVECLENATSRVVSATRRPTPLDRRAADMERELIC